MATSIQDVAREAGVSISTVSRSFTRPDLVSAKTRERVLAIADKLNFSLSRSAAALKSGRSLRIAVLMSGHIRLWFTASVIEGLNEVLHTQGYDISVFQISSIEERKEFLHALGFSTAFTIVTTIVINVIAFAIAYMLTKAIKGSTLFRSVFFMPNLIGGIILGYIWLLLLNGVLAHWGRALTYKASYGFWGLVILVCWQQIGYMMIIYIAGLQALPTDVLEAAAVDGANGRQTMFRIIIPLMMPSITVCSFLTVTNGFKLYDQNLALTNGAPSNMSEGLALNITRTFYGRMGWEGVGQAKAVLFFILVAVIALIQNKLTTSKEVAA